MDTCSPSQKIFAGIVLLPRRRPIQDSSRRFRFQLPPRHRRLSFAGSCPGCPRAPSPQRTQAMFDWWERIFDYDRSAQGSALQTVNGICGCSLRKLSRSNLPIRPACCATCARTRDTGPWICISSRISSRPFTTSLAHDLEDDRWMVRAWHADRWLRRLWHRFTVLDMSKARPDLWASDNPERFGSRADRDWQCQSLAVFLRRVF